MNFQDSAMAEEISKHIHGSNLECSLLVDHLHKLAKTTFIPGENVHLKVKHRGELIDGCVKRSRRSLLSVGNDSLHHVGKENDCDMYEVELKMDESVICTIPATDIEKCGKVPSKSLLRKFIKTNATFTTDVTGNKVWTVSPKYSVKHGIGDKSKTIEKEKFNQDRDNNYSKKLCTGNNKSHAVSHVSEPKILIRKVDDVKPCIKEAIDTSNLLRGAVEGKMKQSTLLGMTSGVQSSKHRKENCLENCQINVKKSGRKISPLLEPEPVVLPSNFPEQHFGDCLMVIEFMVCYKKLLKVDLSLDLTVDNLMKALVDSAGIVYLSDILVCLVRVLVTSRKLKVLEVDVSKWPVTPYSVSELTRLCLKETKEKSHVVSQLQSKDFYNLSVSGKIETLVALTNEVLASCACSEFMEKQRRTAAGLRRKIITDKKRARDFMSNKLKLEQDYVKLSLTTKTFYGGDAREEDHRDLASVVKKRQIAMKHSVEEADLKKKLAAARMLSLKALMNCDRTTQKRRVVRSAVTRISPLGSDRNNCRYYRLMQPGFGLLVEKRSAFYSSSDDADCTVQWYHYPVERLAGLMKSLSTVFPQEKLLKHRLRTHGDFNQNQVKEYQGPKEKTTSQSVHPCSDNDQGHVGELRSTILSLEENLRGCDLNPKFERDLWLKKVAEGKTCNEFASCLLDLHSSVCQEVVTALPGKEWRTEVQLCATFSQLHLLVEILWTVVTRSDLSTTCTEQD